MQTGPMESWYGGPFPLPERSAVRAGRGGQSETLGRWQSTGFGGLLVKSRLKVWVFTIIFRGEMGCLLPQGNLVRLGCFSLPFEV